MRLQLQFISDNSNHTPPPPYSSVPFASPPPRYVSVIGLNETQQNSAKSKSGGATSKSKTKISPKVAPVSLSNSSVMEDQDGDAGLPTYDEALNREERENSNSTNGSSSTGGNVLRVSMV